MSWDDHYLRLAFFIAERSEDPSTQTGAVIVGPDMEIRSTGFNGLPRGVVQKLDRFQRPAKYQFMEHAERNAIYNAARMGTPTLGCSMYVNAFPCADCARGIIQAGIKNLWWDPTRDPIMNKIDNKARWEESHRASEELFREAGISILTPRTCRVWSDLPDPRSVPSEQAAEQT
jgi:dCMP deaminase